MYSYFPSIKGKKKYKIYIYKKKLILECLGLTHKIMVHFPKIDLF